MLIRGTYMTIEKIKMFLAVYTEGSVSNAAKFLHVTQPAISQGIQALEESLNCKLFNREGRKLELTADGHKFLIHARQIVKAYDGAFRDFTEKQTHIKIGSSLTIASYLLSEFVQSYEENTGSYLNVSCCNMQAIKEMIDSNEIDIAFIQGVINTQEYAYYPLGEFQLLFVASPEYTDRRSKEGFVDDFIIRETGSTYRTMFETVCDELNMVPNVKWESTSNGVIKQAVMNNQGIALLSREAVDEEIESGELVVLNIYNQTLSEPYGLLLKRAKADNPDIKDFVAYGQKYFKSLNSSHSLLNE